MQSAEGRTQNFRADYPPDFLSAGDSVLFKAFSEREGGTAQAVTDGCSRQRQAVAGQNGSRVQNKPLSSSAMPKPLSPKGDSYQNAECENICTAGDSVLLAMNG